MDDDDDFDLPSLEELSDTPSSSDTSSAEPQFAHFQSLTPVVPEETEADDDPLESVDEDDPFTPVDEGDEPVDEDDEDAELLALLADDDETTTEEDEVADDDDDWDSLESFVDGDDTDPEEVAPSQDTPPVTEDDAPLIVVDDDDDWEDIFGVKSDDEDSDSEDEDDVVEPVQETMPSTRTSVHFAPIEDDAVEDEEEYQPIDDAFTSVLPPRIAADLEDEDDWDDFDDEEDEYVPDEDEEAAPVAAPLKKGAKKEAVKNDDDFDDDMADEAEESSPKKKSKPDKEKSKKGATAVGKFGERWAKFKSQAAAELKGKDPAKTPSTDLVLSNNKPDKNEELGDEDGGAKPKKGATAAKTLSKLSGNKVVGTILRPFRWLVRLYKKLIDFLFSVIDGVLGFLGKIPLIGWPFRRLKQLSKVLRMVADAIPLVLLLGLLFLTNTHMYPHSNSVKLPDEGSMTFTNFTKKGTEVRGLVTNTGDVVGNVGVTFDIYANKPSLNPISWFKPVKVAECSVKTVGVDIDKAKIVGTHCPKKIPGVWHRVSGHLTPQD